MRISIAAILALFSTGAIAHPGHTESVAGHTHSLGELAMMGIVPVAAGAVLLALVFANTRRNND